LKRFFEDLPDPIDHVMVTGPGPDYASMLEMDADQVRRAIGDHVALGLEIARNAAPKMRPGGTLIFMGGTGGRKISRELGLASRRPPRYLRSRPPLRSSSLRFA
jgi:hypothetical protein